MDALKQAQKDGVVLGLKNVSGVIARLDVDVMLSQQPDTFNLFLLALEALQSHVDPETGRGLDQDKMGYFEIAGIHGLPNRPWDDVRNDKSPGGGSYCPHGSIYFPTWHRPYVALMEQSLYDKVNSIAGAFEDKDRWTAAAQKFRLPYWDYHRPRGGESVFPGVKNPASGTTSFGYDFSMPKILTVPKIMAYRPGAKKPQLMKNPLYSYGFPEENLLPKEWDAVDEKDLEENRIHVSREMTTRHPTMSRGEHSDIASMNQVLLNQRAQKIETMLKMIEWPDYADYTIFSNTNDHSTSTALGSLEGFHNSYHVLVGGQGHMARVPLSAFDPVFWLHHCNIDRILAIWQAIHDGWIRSKEEATAPLLPFRSDKSGSQFWNSDRSRDFEAFGYTYPDVTGPKDQIRSRFDRKYRWSLHEALRPNIPPDPTPDMEPIDVRKTYFFHFEPQPISLLPPLGAPAGQAALADAPSAVEASKERVAPAVHRGQQVLAQAPTSTPKGSEPETGSEAAPSKLAAASSGAVKTTAAVPVESRPRGPFDLEDNEILAKEPEGTKVIRQWFVDNSVERNANHGSFTVFFFIGDFDDKPENFMTSPTVAGINHVFVAPPQTCANCALQADEAAIAYETNPVTSMLLDYIENENKELRSLHPKDVVPFLKANLHRRVLGANSVVLKPEDVKLKVSVSTTLSYAAPGSTIPEYVCRATYPEVTGEQV